MTEAASLPLLPFARWALLVCAAALAAACGSEPADSDGDVGVGDTNSADVSEDATDDVAEDGGSDVAEDGGSDVAADVGTDVAADVGTDTIADTSVEDTSETDVGVEPDAVDTDIGDAETADVGTEDTTPDASPEDVTPDTGPARCYDHITNGSELGVDCGGTCEPCPAPIACDTACADRAFAPGACDMEWADAGLTCEAYCEATVAAHDQRTAWAVTRCIQANPLCFEQMWQCARGAVHPEAFRHDVVFDGTGFEAFNGMDVTIVVVEQGPEDARSSVVAGGRFTVFAPNDQHVGQPLLAKFWVDADGDGVCDEGDDEDFGGTIYSSTDRSLVWGEERITVTPPDRSNLRCDGF